ncbi:hypothetical protein V8687_12040 [Shewanella baltica]|uniref:hypothetical protein n=1 Tax=Shewanella baltica TaxID=62322 RepID=UPI0030D5EDAC
MTRLLLIGLLTVLSFSSFAFDEQPIKDWVEPKTDSSELWTCTNNSNNTQVRVTSSECQKFHESLVPPDTSSQTHTDCNYTLFSPSFLYSCQINGRTSSGWTNLGRRTFGKRDSPSTSQSSICPPDDNPTYKIGPVPESDANPTHMVCKPQFKPCPLGFYRHAVSTTNNGPEQCVPIQCPAKGTSTRDIKNLKDVIPNGVAGTYCDGLCNYSIDVGGIGYQGQQFASGVSLGSQCGQSPVDGQKFTPNGDEKNCVEHTLSNGSLFLECQGGTDEPDPDTDNPLPDSTTSEVPEEPVIDPFTGVECTTVDDKMSCVGGNITDAITKQTKDQAKLGAERHNKLVKQQEEITAYVEKQQDKRETARKNDSVIMIEAIQEITRTLQTNGGTGGNGGGTGGDDTSYIEQFDGDSILAKFQSDLDGMSNRIKDANDGLDSKLYEGISKFGENDPLWNPFRDIPNYLPAEHTCQPFTLGLDEHPLILDLCEYESLIKSVIGFVFIMLTALRLFYQAQIIVRNSAIGSA